MALTGWVAQRGLARLAFNTDLLLFSLLLKVNEARIQKQLSAVARYTCVRVVTCPAAAVLRAVRLCGRASLVQAM
jgi:hypothetical protein